MVWKVGVASIICTLRPQLYRCLMLQPLAQACCPMAVKTSCHTFHADQQFHPPEMSLYGVLQQVLVKAGSGGYMLADTALLAISNLTTEAMTWRALSSATDVTDALASLQTPRATGVTA